MNKAWWVPLLLVGCGGRPASWDQEFAPSQGVALDSSVAVLDQSMSRMLMLSSPAPLELKTDVVPVGLNVATTKASPRGDQLFVLSRGVQPRRHAEDQLPRLTVIDTTPTPHASKRYEFSDPLSGLVLDPEMQWAIAYVTPADSRAVRNPNEIILIDLEHPDTKPIPITIKSQGSSPQSFLFTRPLTVPNGEPRRFLAVLTQRDVVLIDLLDAEHADGQQLSIRMPQNQQGAIGAPLQIAFHDAVVDDQDETNNVPSELAIRIANNSNVYVLSLSDPASSEDPFDLRSNLIEVGGLPATVEFVTTNAGVRLLALVGQNAMLVDPRTSNAVRVSLPATFKAITRVTEDIDQPVNARGDVALLWSDQAASVGLWNLGQSTTTSHGLDTLDVGTTVSQVLDVPGTAYPTFKILESREGDFFVLDLATRETSPMDTNGGNFSVIPAPDGKRLWAYLPGGTDFASIDLENLHAVSLSTELPISGVFDIALGGGAEGRAAIALHESGGGLGATVLNALDPDSAETRFYSGLVYKGITQ